MNCVIRNLASKQLKLKMKARRINKKMHISGITREQQELMLRLNTEAGLFETAINILKQDRRFNDAT